MFVRVYTRVVRGFLSKEVFIFYTERSRLDGDVNDLLVLKHEESWLAEIGPVNECLLSKHMQIFRHRRIGRNCHMASRIFEDLVNL